MSQDLSAVCHEHDAFFEVRPYEVVVRERAEDGTFAVRRIHGGFDVDVYGTIVKGKHLSDPAEYGFICAGIQKLAQDIVTTDQCDVQVIPFPTTIVIDTRRQMLRLGMVRIRILHGRGIEQPARSSEQQALKELEDRLRNVGVRAQSGGSS
jgi:hypothetical protein